jgi:hypothetical protein
MSPHEWDHIEKEINRQADNWQDMIKNEASHHAWTVFESRVFFHSFI